MSLIDSLPRVRSVRLPRADGLAQWIVPLAYLSSGRPPAHADWCRRGCCRRRAASRWRAGSSRVAASWHATSGSASGAPASVSVIGGGIGFAFGLANGLSQLSNKLTDTSLQMVRNIPHLALIPLVILWFGIDEAAKLFLVALGVFFPIYLNTLHGIRTVDPQLIEMGRIYGMTDGELFRRVIFPGALPSIFVGIRFALGIMWLTLIVAETIAASSGLGYMAMQAREFMQIDVVVLSILIYALLGSWPTAPRACSSG